MFRVGARRGVKTRYPRFLFKRTVMGEVVAELRVVYRLFAAPLRRGDQCRLVSLNAVLDQPEWHAVTYHSLTCSRHDAAFGDEEAARDEVARSPAECEAEGREAVFVGEPIGEVGRLLNRDRVGDEEVIAALGEIASASVPEEPSGYVN